MNTPQNNAIASAQALASIMGRYISLMNSIKSYLADYDVNVWDAYWAQLPTAAVNADGTIGSADGSPTSTHPINVPAGTPLLMTRNQLITAKALLSTLQTLYTQGGGTLTVPNQPPATTAAIMWPNA